MKEYKLVTGGRRWHGTEFVDIQATNLDVLQSYFKQFGACVIDGCTVTGTVGNYTVAAGLLAINHADGFKVVRFAGVAGVALPGWIIVAKTVNNKLYDDLNNKLANHDYTASFQTSAPGGGVDFVKIETTGGITFQQALVNKSGWTTIAVSGASPGSVNASLQYQKNPLTNTLQIKGTIIATAAQSLTTPATGITLANLPVGFRPASSVWFNCLIPVGLGGSWFKDYTGIDNLTQMHGLLASSGNLSIGLLRPEPSISVYLVNVNVIIPLD